MTQQQLDGLRNAAKILERMAGNAAKLRDNPDRRKGNARRIDLWYGLSIIETVLQGVSDSLQDMVDQDGEPIPSFGRPPSATGDHRGADADPRQNPGRGR